MTAILIFSSPKDMWPVFRNITGLPLGKLDINFQIAMSGARQCLVNEQPMILAEVSGKIPLEIKHGLPGAIVEIVPGTVEENFARLNLVSVPAEPTLFLVQAATKAA